MDRPIVRLAEVSFDDIGVTETVNQIVSMATDGSRGFVCTPNVDYVVRARRDPAFRDALAAARLCVPDGMGVIYGSRLAGRPLSETVTGRLLPQRLLAHSPHARALPVALFGGPPGVAESAGQRLRALGAIVVDAFGPSMNFAIDSVEDVEAVTRLAASAPAIVFVGLGAPKQEVWMARHAADVPSVLVGIGAGLDVLAGRVGEAPPWMTRLGVEWLFRLVHEPRRLARRYLVDDPRFFWWMLRERFSGRRARGGPE